MAINQDTLNGILSGLGSMPKRSEIDTPTNNIDLLATESSEGLMSAEDKVKLNAVESGANNYILPSAGINTLGGVMTTSVITSTEGYIPTPIINGVPYYYDTIYTLPIATADLLGGVKIGKNITIDESGAISVSDVSADQMTGIVPIAKGGTGTTNANQARLNLKTSCFVITGNITDTDNTNNGYYQAFSVPSITSCWYTIRLLISPITSYRFEEFVVDVVLNTTVSTKVIPVGYMNAVKEQYDIIDKLYISYDASNTTGGYYFWYKNQSANSAIKITILQCTYSNDITLDGLQMISLNTSGARTSADTISTSTPDVITFGEIISTKLVTTSLAGYMSKDDKIKLDSIENGANNYIHPTISGFKHIPSGGSSGQILRWSADGTAEWGNDIGTIYTAGTGLVLSGTKFNHSNSIAAGTAQGDESKTLEFGDTFTIPTVTYDAQGHITSSGTTTMTMPANPNIDTKVTTELATTTKAYITGTTSNTTNTGSLVFDTGVYLDNVAGGLGATSYKIDDKVAIQYNSTEECVNFVFS